MDIRNLPKALILICAVIYVSAGTSQDEKTLENSIVSKDGKPDGAQDKDTEVISPKDGNYKLSYADYEMTWRNYKLEHNKEYPSTREEKRRFAKFMANVRSIEAHNMKYHLGQSTYWMDINHLSDWTQEEFQAWLGPQDEEVHSRSKRQAGMVYQPTVGEKLPQAINWTAKGFVTDVKNQGKCRSCYAFSTTGSVEGQWFRKTGKLINLSEQQIVDCSTDFGNRGCNSGLVTNSFKYIISAGGLQDETTYHYEAKNGTCKFEKSLVVAHIENYYTVPQNEMVLKSAVGTQGPVSVSIYASDEFMNYAGGIFYEKNCTGEGHAVLVVGYGSSDGKDYWIVKNCFGSRKTGGGYIKMARNTGGLGMCGIVRRPSFPVVSDASTSIPRQPSGSDKDSDSSPDWSNKLEYDVITILVTSTLVLLKFTQI